MLYVDIPSRDEVLALLRHRAPASVTVYLETTPLTQDTDASRIALRNLAREAVGQLAEGGAPRGAAAAIAEQLEELAEDDEAWRFQARSLALFATPDRLLGFRLPNALRSMVAVSDRFHVKPLLRAVSFPQVAYVLALAAGSARLLELTPDLPVAERRVEGMPRDAASAVGKASIKDRSFSGRIHGSEGEKVRLKQYARQVDRALRDALHGSDIPLVLAADDTLASLYRAVSTYPHLLPEGIGRTPEELPDAALGQLARDVLDARQAAEVAEARALFETRRRQDRAVSDLAQAARAAVRGAIDTALVDIDAVLPGTLDPETGAVTPAAEGADSYGLVDEIARLTLEAGGRVLALRRQDLPGGQPVAAILRYPLA